MVEDRPRPLGRLGVGDRGADDRVEHLLAEALLQRDERLARVDGAHVGEVEQHAEQRQPRVEAVPRQFDHLHRLLDPLQREVLGLGGDQRVIGGHERVDRQQPKRGRAVDQDHLVVAARVRQRPPERQLAAHLAAEHQLGLGEAQVGGDDVLVDRLGRRRASGEHVGDRRLDVGGEVEVVGQVALGVEIDRQRAHAAAAQDVGEGAHRGRLAGASLLREHSDRVSHCRGDTTRRRAPGRGGARRARRGTGDLSRWCAARTPRCCAGSASGSGGTLRKARR